MDSNVLLQKLKAAYSSLGLSDAILAPLASSLSTSGVVTEENVDGVVAAQKGFLESLQKSNDKRVNDALEKAKQEAEKKLQEVTGNGKAELERMAKELAELRAKQTGNDGPLQEKEEKKDEPRGTESHEWYDAERAKLMTELENRFKTVADGNKALLDAVNALKAENESMKAAEQARKRSDFIAGKAKELGIPEWRVKEGFALANDATEEAITAHLATVAGNIRANELPKGGLGASLGNDGKPDPKAIADIAERLVRK